MQLGDINLHQRLVRIPWPAAKNRFRHRTIPIENPECLWALDRLLARAYDLGSRDPQHYLFPFKFTRSKTSHPHRQMTESGIKKLLQEVSEAADVRWFRPYDCSHTGATRLAEQGTPVQVIMARMGHCSPKMQQHYTHITEQAQRAWLRGRPIQPIRALTPAAGQFAAAPPDTRYAWPPHYAVPSISAWQPVESSGPQKNGPRSTTDRISSRNLRRPTFQSWPGGVAAEPLLQLLPRRRQTEIRQRSTTKALYVSRDTMHNVAKRSSLMCQTTDAFSRSAIPRNLAEPDHLCQGCDLSTNCVIPPRRRSCAPNAPPCVRMAQQCQQNCSGQT